MSCKVTTGAWISMPGYVDTLLLFSMQNARHAPAQHDDSTGIFHDSSVIKIPAIHPILLMEEDHQYRAGGKEFGGMSSSVFPAGSRVQVVSYGPFRGLRGTIRTIDIIADDSEEPYCFYHIVLDGSQIKQPIWFEYDEVELVAAPFLASQETGQLPVVEKLQLPVST